MDWSSSETRKLTANGGSRMNKNKQNKKQDVLYNRKKGTARSRKTKCSQRFEI